MSEVTTVRPAYFCLRCGHEFDRATGVGSDPGRAPKAGSLSLCIRCGDAAFFVDEAPWLRPPTEEERRELEADPEIARIRALLAQAIALRPS